MEELGDARLRCDQLMRYLQEAVGLIEKSDKKDHFFEVAGHLIKGLPETAFLLQKSLQAVALAADRLDYEELKLELRPEKVTELENVLKEVRIRPVPHRSENPMITPKQAAEKLREFARIAREEGALPLHEVAAFIRELDPSRKAHAQEPVADTLERLAGLMEQDKPPASRRNLATLLSRMAMESEFDAVYRIASKPRLTQEHMQLSNVEEVKKKFKAENPEISDEDLAEIAKQWTQNKDVVKDKQALADDMGMSFASRFDAIRQFAIMGARSANATQWRKALWYLYQIVDEIGTILVHLGSMNTTQSEALKRTIKQMMPGAAKTIEDDAPISVMASEDPQPRSAPEVQGAIDHMLDSARKASAAAGSENWKKVLFHTIGVLDGVYQMGSVFETPDVGYLVRARKGFVSLSGARPTTNFAASWKVEGAEDEDKLSRFEEGKPADPTENMSPEDAKRWKEEHDKHKDNFKSAEEDKRTKFEEGKPADPTKNMSPEDAKEWKAQNDEHKDNFKAASWKA